jgi:hypothetical protein
MDGVLPTTGAVSATEAGRRAHRDPVADETTAAALAGHRRRRPVSEPAKVFEDRETPGHWRVEWFGDDGRCELQIFTGPTARRDALRYAMQNYTHFQEAQLEPSAGR